jgi:hypothetical protein
MYSVEIYYAENNGGWSGNTISSANCNGQMWQFVDLRFAGPFFFLRTFLPKISSS